MEVVGAQVADVHHAFDVDVVEGDEEAEVGHAGDAAVKGFTDFVAHVVGFEPVFDVAGGVVGAALAGGCVHARFVP